MQFRPVLENILDHVEGAVSVSLMGTDGIPIEEVRAEPGGGELNVELISAEYAALQKRIAKTNEGLDLKEIRELSVVTDSLAVLVSMVSEEYFILLLMGRGTALGRARYEMRKARVQLAGEVE